MPRIMIVAMDSPPKVVMDEPISRDTYRDDVAAEDLMDKLGRAIAEARRLENRRHRECGGIRNRVASYLDVVGD